jgi:hypothetical protein
MYCVFVHAKCPSAPKHAFQAPQRHFGPTDFGDGATTDARTLSLVIQFDRRGIHALSPAVVDGSQGGPQGLALRLPPESRQSEMLPDCSHQSEWRTVMHEEYCAKRCLLQRTKLLKLADDIVAAAQGEDLRVVSLDATSGGRPSIAAQQRTNFSLR